MQQQELTEQQLRRRLSSTYSLQRLDQTRLRLSRLFVRSQVLDLKRLRTLLMAHQRLSKSSLTRLQQRMLRLNLRQRVLRLLLNSRIGYERSKNIKKSQGQILFAPWLFFMFLLRDSRSASRKCLSIFGTSARSLSDGDENYCATVKKIKKYLQLSVICCIVYVALLWCSGIFMQFFK